LASAVVVEARPASIDASWRFDHLLNLVEEWSAVASSPGYTLDVVRGLEHPVLLDYALPEPLNVAPRLLTPGTLGSTGCARTGGILRPCSGGAWFVCCV
jgi:hypothetical protein